MQTFRNKVGEQNEDTWAGGELRTINAAGRPIRRVHPAVATGAVLPNFCDVSAPSGCHRACAMIADKNFGKIFYSFQNNMFQSKMTRKSGRCINEICRPCYIVSVGSVRRTARGVFLFDHRVVAPRRRSDFWGRIGSLGSPARPEKRQPAPHRTRRKPKISGLTTLAASAAMLTQRASDGRMPGAAIDSRLPSLARRVSMVSGRKAG